jgi:hypothetical protein
MQTDRTRDLLRQYAELRQAREREYGPLSEEMKSEEALASACTAMELAGHPVAAGALTHVHLAA